VIHYFASDIHLRADRPDRTARFTRWLQTLEGTEALLILGDLCDFWMGSRQSESSILNNTALKALAAFRERGGQLSILPGNHDRWLCPLYERALGARIVAEPYEATIHGIRLHMVHGHLLGARRKWKAVLESRAFFQGFSTVPLPIAARLDHLLERRNEVSLLEDEERHLAVFREYAQRQSPRADLVVIGHVHRAVDERNRQPGLVVLGGWQHRSSYLRVDPTGASFIVSDDSGVALTAENPTPTEVDPDREDSLRSRKSLAAERHPTP